MYLDLIKFSATPSLNLCRITCTDRFQQGWPLISVCLGHFQFTSVCPSSGLVSSCCHVQNCLGVDHVIWSAQSSSASVEDAVSNSPEVLTIVYPREDVVEGTAVIPTESSLWECVVSGMVVFHLWNEKKKKKLSGHNELLNQTNICFLNNC